MIDPEKMERAKLYIDKLANGINPVDDTIVPDTDVINDVHLSRYFFFISDVLRQIIDDEKANSGTDEKRKKAPFFIPYEKRSAFAFSENPIPASEIARRLNALINTKDMKNMSYAGITSWLLKMEILFEEIQPSGKMAKRPTEMGRQLGLTVEERIGTRGPYQVVVYNLQAQHFIMDHLDAIV